MHYEVDVIVYECDGDERQMCDGVTLEKTFETEPNPFELAKVIENYG